MADLRARHGVNLARFHLPAQTADGRFGLVQLLLKIRALHRQEEPALLHKRQAQLAEHIQSGHRPGGHNVGLLPVVLRRFLCPCMQAGRVLKAQGGADFFEKADALVQAVQQGQVHLRAGYFQRKPRETRPRADVINGLACKTGIAEQGGAV